MPFSHYTLTGGKIDIHMNVMFGASKDSNRQTTTAIAGQYQEAIIHLTDGKVLHITHLGILDGIKIGKYLATLNTQDLIANKLTWHTEDWCAHRLKTQNATESDHNEHQWPQGKETRQHPPRIQYLISLNDRNRKTAQLAMHGESCYGFRLVDKYSHLTFAYVLGDALLQDNNHAIIKPTVTPQPRSNPLIIPIWKLIDITKIDNEDLELASYFYPTSLKGIPNEAIVSIVISTPNIRATTPRLDRSSRRRPRSPRARTMLQR